MVAALVAGLLAFVATNVDDFFVLLLLYAAGARSGDVLLGQYVGFAGIVAVSVVASLGALVVPPAWAGFLGLVPFGLGLRDLVRRSHSDSESSRTRARVTFSVVASITFSNGGDNVAVYATLFARRPPQELGAILGLFAVLVVTWCLVALRVARLGVVAAALDRWGHRLAPWILMGLGVYVFVSARAWTALWG
jgi:cadmium resistance protein CadD (predicted permease)